MRRIALIAACVAVLGVCAQAQQNTVVNLLDSPVKLENEVYNAGEAIVCSLALPGTAALFGTDTLTGSSGPEVLFAGELFAPFRCWEYDSGCTPTSTWSTLFAGGTMTGLASPNGSTATYWVVNPGGTADEHDYGIGTATGATIPLVALGLLGSGVIDDGQAGEILCVNDIGTDAYTCVDVSAAGAFVCSFGNADNTGGGAFGNGNGDAVAPGDCGGGTLVASTGSLGEGQVTRVGQYDCFAGGVVAGCENRWSVTAFSTFCNGIDEFDLGGVRSLNMLANDTSIVFILQQPVGVTDCQDIDADMDLVYVNASQGGAAFDVAVDTTTTLSVANQKTGAGNGKYVHHMWAGVPGAGTVAPLFDLGNACNSFFGGAAVVANNVGKTNIVGASNYFGTGSADPAKAPAFIDDLTQASIDTANLSVGSQWTHQSIHLNGAASSSKGGSLSNGVVMSMN